MNPALTSHRHHRRHRHAAQSLPSFVDRAGPGSSGATRRAKRRGDPFRHARQHDRAVAGPFHQRPILISAAATFTPTGVPTSAEIQDAYRCSRPMLGRHRQHDVRHRPARVRAEFQITATLAGRIVMEGFLGHPPAALAPKADHQVARHHPSGTVAILYGESGTARLLVLRPGHPQACSSPCAVVPL